MTINNCILYHSHTTRTKSAESSQNSSFWGTVLHTPCHHQTCQNRHPQTPAHPCRTASYTLNLGSRAIVQGLHITSTGSVTGRCQGSSSSHFDCWHGGSTARSNNAPSGGAAGNVTGYIARTIRSQTLVCRCNCCYCGSIRLGRLARRGRSDIVDRCRKRRRARSGRGDAAQNGTTHRCRRRLVHGVSCNQTAFKLYVVK
jgi:hypothetical protein